MVTDFLEEIKRVVSKTDEQAYYNIVEEFEDVYRVFLIGNGGSQAICSHITTDLVKRCGVNAYSLNADSMITCLGNDFGFDNMYSKWLELRGLEPRDMVIALSSSGKSPDILNALTYSQGIGASNLFIYGFEGYDKKFWNNLNRIPQIHLDSKNYGVVEVATEIILHGMVEHLVELIEKEKEDERKRS